MPKVFSAVGLERLFTEWGRYWLTSPSKNAYHRSNRSCIVEDIKILGYSLKFKWKNKTSKNQRGKCSWFVHQTLITEDKDSLLSHVRDRDSRSWSSNRSCRERCNTEYGRNWFGDGERWPEDSGNQTDMTNAGPGTMLAGLGMAKVKSVRPIVERSHKVISKRQRGG